MEELQHSCGNVFIALRKPLSYYPQHFLQKKLHIMLLKSRNRGQDSAGEFLVNTEAPRYTEYTYVNHAEGPSPENNLARSSKPFEADIGMGHLRYTTAAETDIRGAHPRYRKHQRPSKRFAIQFNGNLTNVAEIRKELERSGYTLETNFDTELLENKLAQSLNIEHKRLTREPGEAANMNLVGIANRLLNGIDGAYVIVAIIGNGCGFVISDPRAIRPACYYVDDEIITAASESLPITSAFDISGSKIKYLGPGEGLFVKDKTAEITRYTKAKTPRPCQFEYVYFARPNSLIWEQEVKQVRDRLAIPLARIIENEIGVFDDKHVIFSIPHSSLPATIKIARELHARTGKFLLDIGLTKDDAVRTFISSEIERIGMASTKYDPIESVISGKKCIAVDDSHVRGTTTKQKIIPITFRAGAEELYLAFTCPEIRYPCCYGIDMSSLRELVAFNAAMEVCKEKGLDKLVHKVYLGCLLQKQKLEEEKTGMPKNLVARIYNNLNDKDILRKMVELITPGPELKEKIHLIYQSVSGLRNAIGRGTNICDACLTGNYPTKGGITALNQSFIDYVEKREGRGHENL